MRRIRVTSGAGGLVHALRHHDLAGVGLSLQARGGIDDVADRGEVLDDAIADIPDECVSHIETETKWDQWIFAGAEADGAEEGFGCIDHLRDVLIVASEAGSQSAMTSSPTNLSITASRCEKMLLAIE